MSTTKAELEAQLRDMVNELNACRREIAILRSALQQGVLDLAFAHHLDAVRSNLQTALLRADGFTSSTLMDAAMLDSKYQIVNVAGCPVDHIEPQMGTNYTCRINGALVNLPGRTTVYVRRR